MSAHAAVVSAGWQILPAARWPPGCGSVAALVVRDGVALGVAWRADGAAAARVARPSPARFVGDTPQHHPRVCRRSGLPRDLDAACAIFRSRSGRSIRRWLRRGGTHRRGAGQGSRSRPQRATRPHRDDPVYPASAIAAGHRHGRSKGRIGGPARRVDIHHAGRRVRSRGAYALHGPASAWSPSCRSVEMSTPRHVCSTWACCLNGTYVPARTSPRVCKPPEIMSAYRHLDNVPRVPCPSVALYGSMGARRRTRSMRSSASSSSLLAGPRIRSGCRRSGRPRRLVRCADLNVPATGCLGRLGRGFVTSNQRCPHVYMSTRSVSTYRHPDRLPRGVRPSGGRSWRRLHTRSALPPARSLRRHTDVSGCRHVGPAKRSLAIRVAVRIVVAMRVMGCRDVCMSTRLQVGKTTLRQAVRLCPRIEAG